MFSKFFKKKSLPEIDGALTAESFGKLSVIKVYELVLSNMENAPLYELRHQLTIGSEIGNIVIADPSISPRHVTFILQDEVVSVLDHGSVSGTFINGVKILSGKYIILEDTDVVLVGELEIKLKAVNVSVPAVDIPLAPSDQAPKPVADEKEIVSPNAIYIPDPAKADKPSFNPKDHLKNAKKSKKKPISVTSFQATNSLLRVFAIICDILFSYVLLTVLLPFDEFRLFLDELPELLLSIGGIDWISIWKNFSKDYSLVAEMLQDGFNFISTTFDFGPLLIIFILLRILSTLLFGVSFSELLLGIRFTGNPIWARIGGMLRVIIGIVTGPLLIFDLPAVISRRTFKEIITFTNTYIASKIYSVISVLFFVPVMCMLVLVAPLFQGFEIPTPILVNENIIQRIKVKLPDGQVNVDDPLLTKQSSARLNLELSYGPNDLSVIPSLKFFRFKKKIKVTNSLTFYQKDSKQSVKLEVFKKFDLKELLGVGMHSNYFLHNKYPEIYNFVYQSRSANPSFKKELDDKRLTAFSNEMIQFTKAAFSLGVDNILEVMQYETPLIKGFIDYKASFLSLVEYKNFDQINFIKIGNSTFLKISLNLQKPFDLIIPLIPAEGRIFKVTYDKKEGFEKVSSQFYKFNLNNTDWTSQSDKNAKDMLNAFNIFDLFSGEKFEEKVFNSESAQSLYGYFYESIASLLKNPDPVELGIWKDEVQNMLNLLQELPFNSSEIDGENIKTKLIQNFKDLNFAIENKSWDYFGVSSSTTL